jgi:glucose/arabinose dehydrogenase
MCTLRSRSLLLLAWIAALLAPGGARAQLLAYERVVDGIQAASDFAFAPDGRIFVAELDGTVRVVQNGVLLPTPFTHVTVNAIGERGLLGLALDPDFATNGYVYLYHSVETNPADPEGPKSGRLTRLTAQGNVAAPGSATVLLGTVAGAPSCGDVPAGSDCIPIDSVSHMGGSLRFAPDGMLFVGTGDGIFANVDPVRSLRAQDLDSLAGKVLRIDPRDGSAPSDNPYFTGDPAANRSKVWSYGVRQPFRMGLQPTLGIPIVGDVGETLYEELSFAERGANLGWPCYEGLALSPTLGSDPICQALVGSPPANLRFPPYAYPHVGSAAIVAGVFAPVGAYPASVAGKFVFGDYVLNQVSVVNFMGTPTATLAAGVAGPVDFEIGLDDKVYVLSIADGAIYRLVDVATNVPPFAKASASPIAGLVPLAVQFSSAGSFDSNGTPITYAWDFGDGATSTDANPTHTYTQNGRFTATLTVRDGAGLSDSKTVTVLPGKQSPVVAITSPANGLTYGVGDALHFRATATDADDGPIPSSAIVWVVYLMHCENSGGVFNCHAHLFANGNDALDLVAPDHGTPGSNEFFYLEAHASATDSDGLTTDTRIRIGPDVDGDRCMDFYAPFAVAAAPFDGKDGEFGSSTASAFKSTTHSWNPNGTISSTAIAAAPPSQSVSGGAYAALRGPLAITDAGDYDITFDTFLGGIVGLQPGGTSVDATLTTQGVVAATATGATVASSTLNSHALSATAPGAVQRTPVYEPAGKLPFVVHLDPGSYEWRLVTTAVSRTTTDAASTNFAAAASTSVLREARICKQRLPDSALPQK